MIKKRSLGNIVGVILTLFVALTVVIPILWRWYLPLKQMWA